MSEKEKPALTRRNSGSSKSAKGPPVLSRQCSIQSNQSDYSYATESEYDYDDYGDDMDGLSDVEEERGETPNKLLKGEFVRSQISHEPSRNYFEFHCSFVASTR